MDTLSASALFSTHTPQTLAHTNLGTNTHVCTHTVDSLITTLTTVTCGCTHTFTNTVHAVGEIEMSQKRANTCRDSILHVCTYMHSLI